MSFFQGFITRPVMAIAVNLVILVFGFVALDRLELRHMPKQTVNQFNVKIEYPGASSLSVENELTKPLEDALSGLEGLKRLSSDSRNGEAEVFVTFNSDVDHKSALSELRDRVYTTLPNLPKESKRPEIREQTEQGTAIMYISFIDPTKSMAALSDYVRRVVEERLRLVEGVASIGIFGNRIYEIAINLDPMRLVEHKVNIREIIEALRKEKVFASGGEFEQIDLKKTTVLISSPLETPQDLADLPIKVEDESIVRLKDLAEIQVTDKPNWLRIRTEGTYPVTLGVEVKPNANPLTVAKNVKDFLKALSPNMPTTLKTNVVWDATQPFERSLKSLHHTLWEAIILVALIVVVALASFRSAFLPILTVPLCLIGTFALMWVLGFSVNPVTLLALVLAVGLVVDDAIVVVENIHHHLEAGLKPLIAAKQGMKEISFAVIVMTLTLAAVYLPIAFQQDDTATMFKEFAWTLAGSVIISGFVALTLTPALSARFLKETKKITAWEKINASYGALLSIALKNPGKIALAAILVVVLGGWGWGALPVELFPREDTGWMYGGIASKNNPAMAVKETWMREVEKVMNEVPEKLRSGFFEVQQRWLSWFIVLPPPDERSRSALEIGQDLEQKFKSIVGPMVNVNYDQTGNMSDDANLKIILQYRGEYEPLLTMTRKILEDLEQNPLVDSPASDQLDQTAQLKVTVDKPLAQELGVDVDTLESTLYTFLSGSSAAKFRFQGFDYDIMLRADPVFRKEWTSINQFFVPTITAAWVPLGSFITLKEVLEPSLIKHNERIRSTTIVVPLKPSVSLDQAMTALTPIVKQHLLPDSTFKYGGKAEKFQESRRAAWLTYGLALVFIYLVLAALFESFVHPFVVLLTVPLSIAGAIGAVFAISGTNNIYTAIGLVTLIGLISKHGVLIVDFANRLRAQGLTTSQAIFEASKRRLRPILMTTLAMIFGAVPLIFSGGSDANARHHIGWIMIGGMTSGTLFSLFVVPVAYQFIHRRHSLFYFRFSEFSVVALIKSVHAQFERVVNKKNRR